MGATGQTVVAYFPGAHVALTDRTLIRLSAALGCLPGKPQGRRLILDVSNVRFVSGAALRVLARLDLDLQASGGCLSVRDRSGEVYEFFLAAKLALVCPQLTPPPCAGPRVIELPRPAAPVLLVAHHDPAMRALLGRGLTRRGFTVWPAATGWDVLDRYRRHPGAVAAVLLDTALSGPDGPETLAALRRLDHGVRCGFLADAVEPHSEEFLLSLGAAVVFREPFAMREVAGHLRRLLAPSG
jgi:CheY-like chemotaxis protein